jgi:hypothetical protein
MTTTWPNNALEPAPVGALRSAFAVDIIGPAWLRPLGGINSTLKRSGLLIPL